MTSPTYTIIRIGAFLYAACAASVCLAIDTSVEKWPILTLNGEIKTGDAEALARDLVLTSPKGILISSPGGSVSEAIRMAALIKGSHIPVIARGNGGYCASSCFFLFLAADTRMAAWANDDGSLPSNWKSQPGGPIGIHRPYLKFQSSNTNSTIEKQEQAVRDAEIYLKAQRLPQHLIDLMLSRPSNDIYWLNQKDLETIGEYSAGYSEALVAKCNYITTARLVEKMPSKAQRTAYIEEFTNCQQSLWDRERFPLAKQFYKKLATGWRPWKS